MRQLNTQEIEFVSGSGLLTSALATTFKTTVAAGAAAGQGLLAAGKGLAAAGVIVGKPLLTGAVNFFKFLI